MGNFVNNMEFFLLLPHKENILNIELKNIKKDAFGKKIKTTLNQMNIITKAKNLLKNPINIIKNMITRNSIKGK